MTVFRYKAVANDGQILYGEIDAPSKGVAIARLQSSGHLPISAEEVDTRGNFFRGLINKFNTRDTISRKDIGILTSELATLLQAGLPLDVALKTMEGFSTSVPVKNLISDILQRIQGGVSLSDAMAEQGGIFNRLYINMVRAGEAGGSLQTVIDRMAIYLERMDELRSSVLTALIYPAILVVISSISLLILMTFVVPQFVPLFEDVGQALPFITQIVFGFADILRSYWWLLFAAIACAVWLIDKQLSDPAKRLRFDGWTLGLPYVGGLVAQLEVARLTRTLGTLLNNGVPLLTAVTLVRDVLNNRMIAQIMESVIASLEQGQRLARPLKESKYFPPLAVQLIEVGEESGQLESMLMKIADIYDKEVQTSIKRLLTLLEPVLIIGLGGIIAIIISSILVAMLGLNDLVI